MFKTCHKCSGTLRLLHLQLCRSHLLSTLPTLFTHRLQRPDTAFIPSSAGLDPLTNPNLFFRQLLIKLRLLDRFRRQQGIPANQKCLIVAGPVKHAPPIHLNNPVSDLLQKHPVVGDKDQSPLKTFQEALQPENGLNVQMVSRLIQQQDVRFPNHCPSQQHPALHSRRQRGEQDIRRQLHFQQQRLQIIRGRPAFRVSQRRTGRLVSRGFRLRQRMAFHHAVAQTAVVGNKRPECPEPFSGHLKRRAIPARRHFLIQTSDQSIRQHLH